MSAEHILVGSTSGERLRVTGDPVARTPQAVIYPAVGLGERSLAVKLYNASLDARQIRRAAMGANIQAGFSHPHITELVMSDVTDRGQLMVVTPLADTSLFRAIDQVRQDPHLALKLTRQIGSALNALHEGGMVHGDVNPTNVLLRKNPDGSWDGELTDFEGATPIGTYPPQPIHFDPFFGAPELLEGRFSPAADQFELAALLHFSLSGRSPFDSASMRENAEIGIYEYTPPQPLPKNTRTPIHDAVTPIIRKALSENPEHRYPSVGDMLEAIDVEIAKINPTD